jgi:hypothetical protein
MGHASQPTWHAMATSPTEHVAYEQDVSHAVIYTEAITRYL